MTELELSYTELSDEQLDLLKGLAILSGMTLEEFCWDGIAGHAQATVDGLVSPDKPAYDKIIKIIDGE
jgi:hypothetical protein